MTRIVVWFSCGAASAVTVKLLQASLATRDPASYTLTVARIFMADEDEDNSRFAKDCEAWFCCPVVTLASTEYASAEDVWTRRRYMAGRHGAPCTVEMKKAVRWDFERARLPDEQAFGFTADAREVKRAERFRQENPEVRLLTPLIDSNVTKVDCYAIVQRAGLVLPIAYRQGFDNANCIGCVKAQSPGYWNRTRQHYPEVFARRAALSRDLGARLVKTTSGARERLFLDQLDPADMSDDGLPSSDCSIACGVAEHEIAVGDLL